MYLPERKNPQQWGPSNHIFYAYTNLSMKHFSVVNVIVKNVTVLSTKPLPTYFESIFTISNFNLAWNWNNSRNFPDTSLKYYLICIIVILFGNSKWWRPWIERSEWILMSTTYRVCKAYILNRYSFVGAVDVMQTKWNI